MHRFFRALAVVLGPAVLLAGCGDGGTDSSNLPLRLSVQPSGPVSPGDSLRMTVHLVNPGRTPVRMEFDDQCQVVFYVMAPDKTVLHPAGGGASCMGGPTTLEVPARDSLPFSDVWLVASSFAREHSAYAVLWEHHEVVGGEREYEKGHRSNIVTFSLATPAP